MSLKGRTAEEKNGHQQLKSNKAITREKRHLKKLRGQILKQVDKFKHRVLL